jgi:arylsulfatase A
MRKNTLITLATCISLITVGCSKTEAPKQPNIILIMADDMGYECLSCNGSTAYSTPNLDKLASEGIRGDNCISQPLCTPSRVKIMTGKYNHRNYEYFTYLNPNQRTFGNALKEAGYETCIVGKWQLNGLKYDLDGYKDMSRPVHFGFDEYCLWQLTHTKSGGGERFANPFIEQNGKILERDEDAYGPDIFFNYATNFIERNAEKPFLLYYPMVLVHDPFVPTPDSEEWSQKNLRYRQNKKYFKDMVEYADKIVGGIVAKLEELDIADNTLLIFTGDNGTHYSINTSTINGNVKGAKGNTINTGVHVPLVMSWPKMIKSGKVHKELIEFSDFFPTITELAGLNEKSDGQSFVKLLKGDNYKARETAFVHYDPRWSKRVNQYRNMFVQTTDYKLYQDGSYYDIKNDPLEENNLKDIELTGKALTDKKKLQSRLDKAPEWK